MIQLRRNTVVVGLVVVATLLPMVFAGVARLVRWQRESVLEGERTRLAEYRAQVEEAEWRGAVTVESQQPTYRLLEGAEVAATLQVVQTLADGSGVTLVAAKASPTASDGRQLFLLAGRGRPQQLCSLVAAIERHERLIVVESGRVTPRDDQEVEFELGLATWHRGGER